MQKIESGIAGKDTAELYEWFQAFHLHKTPPVVGVISLEGG